MLLIFFFNDTATTEIYTLSLHDALPISTFPCPSDALGVRHTGSLKDRAAGRETSPAGLEAGIAVPRGTGGREDRKSTRLNSSHANISYAVFCLKKKNITSSPASFCYVSC